jgi:Peptide-N-glycosidase F, C terminal/FlgD Ig-like domain
MYASFRSAARWIARPWFYLSVVIVIGLLVLPRPAIAETVIVNTFNREFINWATPHESEFQFPPQQLYSDVKCHITIACPPSPGDCDPWDRFGRLDARVYQTDTTWVDYEIARFITPYDITFNGGPQVCPWVVDVTDYQFLLHDDVSLVLYIDSWIGGDKGWLLTVYFEMISGTPEREPYQVERLWRKSNVRYGDPDNPPEDHLVPVNLTTPADAIGAKVRVFSTGHGFYNTDNAAEFSYKWQQLEVDGLTERHDLWRGDCDRNPCSPQLGTWEYNRAGWCPGDKADAWEVDVSDWLIPGTQSQYRFILQPYVNWCRPNNPDCVDNSVCECAGHAFYRLEGQVIYYRASDLSAVEPQSAAIESSRLSLAGNHPNPFGPSTTLNYRLSEPGDVRIAIFDATGSRIRYLERQHESAGLFTWDWDGLNEAGLPVPGGVYMYELKSGTERASAKMMLLR